MTWPALHLHFTGETEYKGIEQGLGPTPAPGIEAGHGGTVWGELACYDKQTPLGGVVLHISSPAVAGRGYKAMVFAVTPALNPVPVSAARPAR